MSVPLSPVRIETTLWVLLCIGLASVIGIETDWGNRWRSPLPTKPAEASVFAMPSLSEPYHLPPADQFLETAMRPIFVVTRRPPPPPPPPEAPRPSMKRDQFTLTGITVLPDGKFAFLTEKAGNKNRVVQEGKEINGITVKEIHNDRVVLGQYDETEVLVLRAAKGPTATTQPAAEKGAAGNGAASGIGAPPTTPGTAPVPGSTETGASRPGTSPSLPRTQGRTQPPTATQ